VGSYNDDIGPDANQGSVYLFYNHFPTSSDDVYSVNAGYSQ